MAGHIMALTAFFVKPDPKASILPIDIFDRHSEGCPDAGKGIDHQRNQGAVATAPAGRLSGQWHRSAGGSLLATAAAVFPRLTTCLGPRTAVAGFVATI